MNGSHPWRRSALLALLLAGSAAMPARLAAQTPDAEIIRVALGLGRSYPIATTSPINRVSVANPEVADVAVVGERDVVINARQSGETDVIVWATGVPRRHYRVVVQSGTERMQVVLNVKIAEIRKDLLNELGVSGLFRDDRGNVRAGTGIFRTDNVFGTDGSITLPSEGSFLTVLTDFGTDQLLGLIEAQAQRGNARILAEPNLMAANREQARFLAGGELPIPIAQPNPQGGSTITVQYREFGVRLQFTPEILNDSLIKLQVMPEVSSLDYGNAVIIAGFRVPALRTRRVESTVDVRRNTSLVISGLFNSEREEVRTGIPFLMDVPILGNLFSSTRWQNNETELVVIVTPRLVDPNRPRTPDAIPLQQETRIPAREALEERLTAPPAAPATTQPRPAQPQAPTPPPPTPI